MSEARHEHPIPPLTENDFVDAELEILLSGDDDLDGYLVQFHQLREHDPLLARQILLAAHSEGRINEEYLAFTESLRAYLNVIKAIELALGRVSRSQQEFSDGGGDSQLIDG